jgi:hypothetical protein
VNERSDGGHDTAQHLTAVQDDQKEEDALLAAGGQIMCDYGRRASRVVWW